MYETREIMSDLDVALDAMENMLGNIRGRLFNDVSKFHQKFDLQPTRAVNHTLPDDVVAFRSKFMVEELNEYLEACGAGYKFVEQSTGEDLPWNPEKAFDALIDLVYVALGTAYLHRFPFDHGWARVQRANMAKVRASSASDERSVRKHSMDVVKPPGWTAPDHSDLIDCEMFCTECDRSSKVVMPGEDCPCGNGYYTFKK